MTAPESSLSRWSRLKREAVSKGQMGVDRDDTPARSAGPQDGQLEAGLDEGLVGPEELPSVDTITVDTDIRAFLKSRVPAELTRAALRRAWSSDPAIRDFIGIAENQWDFNDPTAIAGFGPLQEADDISVLLRQAFGQPSELATAIAELPIEVEPLTSAEIASSQPPDVPDRPNGIVPARAEAERPKTEDAGDDPPRRRSHGGALPR